jgi:predicted DNA-binding protein YlxM (UPF0122 family)
MVKMDVLNLTSRKRETYQIRVEYSLLWECALGIAAYTNTPLLDSLEKPKAYWDKLKSSFSEELMEQLVIVERDNSWKALLQLLHLEEFKELPDFISKINRLPEKEFRFQCLPFLGDTHQFIREQAASGSHAAMEEMKGLSQDNSFFPRYIEYIFNAEVEFLKTHLISVFTCWYEEVILNDNADKLLSFLKTDGEAKKQMGNKMSPEELVEWATGGVTYHPEPSVSTVLLIPQFIYRPWNIEADIEGTKVFYYPISNESMFPDNKYVPDNFLVLKHKALGDEVRLQIVKLLHEKDRTLQDITEHLNIGKSTIHHHLKILRAAKLVVIQDSKYALKKHAVQSLAKELALYLEH